jgi:hypothetical protein
MQTEAAYRNPPAAKSENSNPSVTFNSAFVERRMREHQIWQEAELQAACLEVVEEVELAHQRATERVSRDIRRSPLFQSIRRRHRISPKLLRSSRGVGA